MVSLSVFYASARAKWLMAHESRPRSLRDRREIAERSAADRAEIVRVLALFSSCSQRRLVICPQPEMALIGPFGGSMRSIFPSASRRRRTAFHVLTSHPQFLAIQRGSSSIGPPLL